MAANNYSSFTYGGTQYSAVPVATNQPYSAFSQATSAFGYSSGQPKQTKKPHQTRTTNSGGDAPAALDTAGSLYMQQQASTASLKTNAACKNNIKIKMKKPEKPPNPQNLYNCDTCVICSNLQSYQEHLEGQKHKKKEAAKAADCAKRGNFLCKLCNVATTNFDGYNAHIHGAKHKKVVRERKEIVKLMSSTETVVINSSNSATINKPPNVVSGIKLSTKATNTAVPPPVPAMMGSLMIGNEDQGKVEDFSKMEDTLECQLSAQIFFENIKNDKGKVISVLCKLCNCSLSGPKEKEVHAKGIPHRLQFKKKVNPDLIVDVNPLEQIRVKKNLIRQFWRRCEDKSWRKDMRMVEEERLCLEERRLCEEVNQNGCDMIGLSAPHRPFPTEIQARPPMSVTEEKREIKRRKEKAAIKMTMTNESKPDHVDTGSPLSNQEREDRIANAQRALELFAIHHIYDILGIDQLPPQRFGQKRRWDNSSEEGTEECADGKRIKQEN